MTSSGEIVLAHHALITAIPFVVPAFIVVGLVGAIVWRDRRETSRDAGGDRQG